MFPLAESKSSAIRFRNRVVRFTANYSWFPRVIYGFWWFVHNCVSHPFIGLFPVKPFFWFHDWTSKRLNPPFPGGEI